MAALGICYMLYFRSQASPGETGMDESSPISVVSPAAAPHSAYKADLDRAHAAARQMKDSHAEAESY
jgi:hypothetical protein